MPIRLRDFPGHRPQDKYTCGECTHGCHHPMESCGQCDAGVRKLINNSMRACNEGFEEISGYEKKLKWAGG